MEKIDETMIGLSPEQIAKLAELDSLFHAKEEEIPQNYEGYSLWQKKINDFYLDLLSMFTDAEIRDRYLFHVIIHSLPHNRKIPHLDFDVIDKETGETKHLIEDFIRGL